MGGEAESEIPARRVGAAGMRQLQGAFLHRPASGAAVGTILVFVVFSVLTGDTFLTLPSFASTLTIAAELGIVAMGVTLLMIGGEFDLSVGSVLGVSSVTVPWLAERGWPVAGAIPVAFLVAAMIGFINGAIVNRTQIPSFIVTLGGLFWWRGVLFAITKGFPINVPQGNSAFEAFSARLPFGFNVSLFWFIGLGLLLSLVLARTRFGNWVFATGGNVKAAEALGIPVRRVKLILFVIAALCAALAGVIQVGRFSGVDSLRGTGLELEAVAAAVIGGSRLSGGYGSIAGTAFGVLMLGIIQNGLVLAGISSYWYRAFIGLLIVLVVIVNQRAGRLSPPT